MTHGWGVCVLRAFLRMLRDNQHYTSASGWVWAATLLQCWQGFLLPLLLVSCLPLRSLPRRTVWQPVTGFFVSLISPVGQGQRAQGSG
jgi:hypothetical protein